MTRTIVTGAGGQLGTAFRKLLPDAQFLTRADLDLTDRCGMREPLTALAPDTVINCAAYTAVDRAEEEEELATRVNGTAVAEMAEYCAAAGARFVTFSTDYVFSGVGGRPWVESDATDPVNAYGRSKLIGEQAAVNAGALVIRASWVVSGTHPNFIATMLRLGAAGPLTVVDDQHGCPTIADDLAAGTIAALEAGASGLLHLTNQGPTTWYEFAGAALRHAGISVDTMSPCTTAEFPTPARRPAYSVLDSERMDKLGIDRLPEWRESLPAVVDALYENGVVARP